MDTVLGWGASPLILWDGEHHHYDRAKFFSFLYWIQNVDTVVAMLPHFYTYVSLKSGRFDSENGDYPQNYADIYSFSSDWGQFFIKIKCHKSC